MGSDMGKEDIEQVTPRQAWEVLANSPETMLIDVRTQVEWGFVGVPDLSSLGKSTKFVEWASWPGMSQNTAFTSAVTAEIGSFTAGTLLFLCRSGARSLHAAHAMTEHLHALGHDVKCVNVAEGFEGDLDDFGHRGRLNGWKFHGLSWRQS